MELILSIASIIGIAFPIFIHFVTQKKISTKVKKRLDLLESKYKLLEFEKKHNITEDELKLLESTRLEIDEKLKEEANNKIDTTLFLVFIVVEIFLLINYLGSMFFTTPAVKYLRFLEGIFAGPIGRTFLVLTSLLLSFIFSSLLIKYLNNFFKDNFIKLNIILIAIFNISLGLIYCFLLLLDYFVSWF